MARRFNLPDENDDGNEQPELVLIDPRTATGSDFAAMFERLTGRSMTPDEVEDAAKAAASLRLSANAEKSLSTDDMVSIQMEVMTNSPPQIRGKEADAFRASVKKTLKKVQDAGGTLEIPKLNI